MLFHMEFDIIALIGVILLIGIVKKNAILIIDFALVAEREEGLSSRDAIYEACMLRFRPILMTTMAAILGALPLAIGFGEGGELRRPLGIAIIGGLVASQVLTLITTPVVYLYMDKLRKPRKRSAAGRPAARPPSPARAGAPVRYRHDPISAMPVRAVLRLLPRRRAAAVGLPRGAELCAAHRRHARRAFKGAPERARTAGSPASRWTPSTAAPGGRCSAIRCWTGWSARSRSPTRTSPRPRPPTARRGR